MPFMNWSGMALLNSMGNLMSFGQPSPYHEGGELSYILAYPEETETGQAISISESEIANLIKSKGAVFAAIKSLVDYVGLVSTNWKLFM